METNYQNPWKPLDNRQPTLLLDDIRQTMATLDDLPESDASERLVLTELLLAKFAKLDNHLTNGGIFPAQWITKDNQLQRP